MTYFFWVLVAFLIGRWVGWNQAHLTIAGECEKLGCFYVRKITYYCTTTKESK